MFKKVGKHDTGEDLNIVSNEDSMENNYMVVMLWNLTHSHATTPSDTPGKQAF